MDRNVMWFCIVLVIGFVVLEAIRNGAPFKFWWGQGGSEGGVEVKPRPPRR